jgi:hypothetical protein
MKKFVFRKYLKYVSSISEWFSSLYTFDKKKLFILNNNEKKAYDLIYHYFSSNITYKKTTVNIKPSNLKSIYINFFSKFILSKPYFINNLLNWFYPERNNLLFFYNKDNIKDNRILRKKALRLSRLLKYRLRRKFYLKSLINRSVNKLYISKPEIKYSIKEVIITVYIYNREKFFILKKLSRLNMYFKYILEINKSRLSKKKKLKKINSPFKILKKGIIYKIFNLISFNNNNLNSYYDYFSNKNIKSNNFFTLFKLKNNKYILNNIKKIFYMNIKKIFMCKYYLGLIYLTNYKFNNNNLTELKNKLYKIYKKKININIVNLKYLYLENTIFLDALMNKLNDRKKKALKVIRKGLSLGKIVKLHPLFYRERKVEENDSNKELNKIDHKLDNLIKLKDNKKNKYINIILGLKNKHVSGLRVEAKGRLTKRLTASRAVYKISYKGSLKNIYSSYNKLSTLILRGLTKSNTVYVNTNSKNRNGSYGVKYWLSTY